jgi:citrate lyase subunit beta / citryl-CoA lyase
MTADAAPAAEWHSALGPALLFCPADRPERYAKAADRADAVILDLEDAVTPDARPAARDALASTPLDPARTIVRVNAAETADFALDVEALRATAYRYVMLPKATAVPDELRGFAVVALCETAAGVLAAPALAEDPSVVALMWGAEDLVASLGGSASRFRDGHYRAVALHARSAVLIAAGAHGKAAIDSVHLDIADVAGLGAEARDAVASGFAATACIHPSQVDMIREAYAPTPDEVAHARAVLAAAEGERGVFQFDGRMVDEPVLRHARRVLERATPRTY